MTAFDELIELDDKRVEWLMRYAKPTAAIIDKILEAQGSTVTFGGQRGTYVSLLRVNSKIGSNEVYNILLRKYARSENIAEYYVYFNVDTNREMISIGVIEKIKKDGAVARFVNDTSAEPDYSERANWATSPDWENVSWITPGSWLNVLRDEYDKSIALLEKRQDDENLEKLVLLKSATFIETAEEVNLGDLGMP